jgi:hypothetical protein
VAVNPWGGKPEAFSLIPPKLQNQTIPVAEVLFLIFPLTETDRELGSVNLESGALVRPKNKRDPK